MSLIEAKFANECRIGFKWKIKEEDLRNLLEGGLTSKEFKANIPGVKYYIVLYPNGRHESEKNHVLFVLHLKFEMIKNVNGFFTLSFNSFPHGTRFSFKNCDESGFERYLCTRDALFDTKNKFFIDGFMEVELNGGLETQGIKRKAPDSVSLTELLWKNDDEKDVTFVVGEKEIKVHKWILCAKSHVFKIELKCGLKETKENKIVITDFSFETVQIVVEHFYEREIKDLINEKNASELLHFADKYNIEPLHEFIQTLLIEKLSQKNIVEFANASLTSNAENLRECCICFLISFAGKKSFITDIEELKDEIASEMCRRLFFSAS
uniref:BTB domain-containing protein n=1 Tax=Panagrolaimus sp. ES5 TaxID=591445 RepID=A0AC34F341_9BILA